MAQPWGFSFQCLPSQMTKLGISWLAEDLFPPPALGLGQREPLGQELGQRMLPWRGGGIGVGEFTAERRKR